MEFSQFLVYLGVSLLVYIVAVGFGLFYVRSLSFRGFINASFDFLYKYTVIIKPFYPVFWFSLVVLKFVTYEFPSLFDFIVGQFPLLIDTFSPVSIDVATDVISEVALDTESLVKVKPALKPIKPSKIELYYLLGALVFLAVAVLII